MPKCLEFSEENLSVHASQHVANQYLYVHIAYQQCILFLNRNAMPAPSKPPRPSEAPKQFVEGARAKAIAAAGSISSFVAKARQHNVVAPFAGFCAYTASAMQIHCAFSKDKELQERAKHDLAININYLTYMKAFWGNFHFMTDNLKEMYKRVADLASKGTITPDTRAEDCQYGDWYDRYPHGVSTLDYDEPASKVKKEAGDDAAMSGKTEHQSVEEFFQTLSPKSQAQHTTNKLGEKRGLAPAGRPLRRSTATKVAPRRSSQAVSETAASGSARGSIYDGLELRRTSNGFAESYERSPVVAQQQSLPRTNGQRQAMQMPNPPTHQYPISQIPPSSYMAQQDGQLAYSAYNSMDPSVAGLPEMNSGYWGDMDYSSLGDEFFMEPNNAWFAPFNLPPPNYTGSNDSFVPEPQMMLDQQDPNMSPTTGAGPGPGPNSGQVMPDMHLQGRHNSGG